MNSGMFKPGHIRKPESIQKQSDTMKEQFKLGIRKSPAEFMRWSRLPISYKTIRKCEKCGKEYKITSGMQRWCKECVPNHKYREYIQLYNLSKQEHDSLLIKNNGLCWICSKRIARCVDHSHKTGKVRGLLCGNCNSALHVIENQELLDKAIKYLENASST